MSESTRRAREIEEAVRPASERHRARRTGIDAVASKADLWFESGQVAEETLSATPEDEPPREIPADVTRMKPSDRRPLLDTARQIVSPGGDGQGPTHYRRGGPSMRRHARRRITPGPQPAVSLSTSVKGSAPEFPL